MKGIVTAWGRILTGYQPVLSIEITRECPLRCPGCYAYGDDYLGGDLTLRELRDFKGQELIDGVLALVERQKPVQVSIIGGEPLVRYRELDVILPALAAKGIHVQLVTSAVREIPRGWCDLPKLAIVVSIDGLAPEHDARRAPATYERILKHIASRRVTIHCTVTRQQAVRPGYVEEFLRVWSARPEVRRIWFSLYTPQVGEVSDERLTPVDRRRVIADLTALRSWFPKLEAPEVLLDAYAHPPNSPDECVFARTTTSVSANLKTPITPCQFGGNPDCSNCGCLASAALAAVGRHQLFGVVPVGSLFADSVRVGETLRRLRPARTQA